MKEDINVEDDDYNEDYRDSSGTGGGAEGGSDGDPTFAEGLHQYSSDWSNSSLPTSFDPAIVSYLLYSFVVLTH